MLILGDWGTSTCRLHLLRGGDVIDAARGPGIKGLVNPAEAFAEMTSQWRARHGAVPALLCGTVGANIGWADAGYVPCPATLEEVVAGAIQPAPGVRILPGVATEANMFGLSDVMRSEEIQAFGFARMTGRTTVRLCLPGTHTKWVEMEAGSIRNATTGFTGELFAALSEHTLLASPGEVALDEAFRAGVRLGAGHPSLVSALFATRAEAARGRLSAAEARARLSGLIIGADCAGALDAWGVPPDAVVGAPALCAAYVEALSELGHGVDCHDGEAAALAGLGLAAERMGLAKA